MSNDQSPQLSGDLNQCAMSGQVSGEVKVFTNSGGEAVRVKFALTQMGDNNTQQRFTVECVIPQAIEPAKSLRDGQRAMAMGKVYNRSGAMVLRAYVVYKIESR